MSNNTGLAYDGTCPPTEDLTPYAGLMYQHLKQIAQAQSLADTIESKKQIIRLLKTIDDE